MLPDCQCDVSAQGQISLDNSVGVIEGLNRFRAHHPRAVLFFLDSQRPGFRWLKSVYTGLPFGYYFICYLLPLVKPNGPLRWRPRTLVVGVGYHGHNPFPILREVL